MFLKMRKFTVYDNERGFVPRIGVRKSVETSVENPPNLFYFVQNTPGEKYCAFLQ